jgi:hypothetical protein
MFVNIASSLILIIYFTVQLLVPNNNAAYYLGTLVMLNKVIPCESEIIKEVGNGTDRFSLLAISNS